MSAILVTKIVGLQSALDLAKRCIMESAFVEVTPLPDDLYEVGVKRDAEHLLHAPLPDTGEE